MNIMAVNWIVGRMQSDATGEGRLVALARGLSLLLAPLPSPPWAELSFLGPQVQSGVCLSPDPCPSLITDGRQSRWGTNIHDCRLKRLV